MEFRTLFPSNEVINLSTYKKSKNRGLKSTLDLISGYGYSKRMDLKFLDKLPESLQLSVKKLYMRLQPHLKLFLLKSCDNYPEYVSRRHTIKVQAYRDAEKLKYGPNQTEESVSNRLDRLENEITRERLEAISLLRSKLHFSSYRDIISSNDFQKVVSSVESLRAETNY